LEKRYRFRIYPTAAQTTRINRFFGCSRFIYNHFLAKHIERYKSGEGYWGLFDVTRELPKLKKQEGFKWLSEAPSEVLSYALCDLDNAFKMFFRRIRQCNTGNTGNTNNTAPGFPKFKVKRAAYQSYRCKNKFPKPPRTVPPIELGENAVKLPKLGWVKCRVSRQTEGRILNASVIQAPSGRYYVSLYCTDVISKALPKTDKAIGLHLGLKNLATTSDGQRFENRRYGEKAAKKLSRLHKGLSRKTSGSANWEKARRKLAKECEAVANRRKNNIHELTTGLVRQYDIIAVHNSSVKGMLQKRTMSKLLADAGWSELTKQLSYKCRWYGKTLIKVPENFASAQLCSLCGNKYTYLKKRGDLQQWTCPQCGAIHDRGVNSANNLLNEGLKILETV